MFDPFYKSELEGILNQYFPYYKVWNVSIPEGYQIIETPTHKKERLTNEIASKKQTREIYEKQVLSLSKKIDDLEKELASLTTE